MSKSSKRRLLVYDTHLIYTFHFWQHLLDLNTFQLRLPFITLSAAKYLGTMPVRIMAGVKGGELVWDFCLWHRTQLQYLKPSAGLPGDSQQERRPL